MIIIFLICLYSYNQGNKELSPEKCLKYPEKYDTCELICRNWKIVNLEKDGFEIKKGRQKIWIKIKNENIVKRFKKDEIVSIKGIFYKQGYIKLQKFHIHKNRKSKQIFSIFSVILVLFLFFSCYEFDFKKLIFKERKNAGFNHPFYKYFCN
ncbi:MAG: hypothetical protein ABIB46_04150 [bacterium]